MRKNFLYCCIWIALVALSFIGAVTCAISEGCSIACDALDAAWKKLERHQNL